MIVTVKNAPLRGTCEATPSKSDAHRALICAALADAPTEINIAAANEDISATIRCLTALGADIKQDGGRLTATAISGRRESPLLDCGESGSTLRFLLPVAAAVSGTPRFTGRGLLPRRPIAPLIHALAQNGCASSGDSLPLTLSGKLSSGTFTLPGDVSSQFVSGLLMALPLLQGDSRILLTTRLQSSAYAEMTLNTLERFGVHVNVLPDGYEVAGGQMFRCPGAYEVEGDWSGAAFFLVADAIGGHISIKGVDQSSSQPDKAIAALAYDLPEKLDVSPFPDLFPALAVRACAKKGDTLLCGAERLRLKESDRIRETARFIRDLGGSAEESSGALLIHGRGRLSGGVTHSGGDHRIAMAAAIAAALCETPVTIQGAEAVDKSFPSFWEEITKLSK